MYFVVYRGGFCEGDFVDVFMGDDFFVDCVIVGDDIDDIFG